MGVATFGNGIIDSVGQVGGWPELLTYDVPLDTDNDGMPDEWETLEGLDISDPSDRFGIKEGEVYDNLERYLNQLASDKAYLLPPVNLSASLQNDTVVVLSWRDITDDELGFVIQSTDTDGAFVALDTVEANVTEYSDTLSGPGRTIGYRVFAISDSLRSIPSRPASIELTTGLETKILREVVRVYPNPFEEYCTFEYLSSREQGMKVRLYDTRGMLVGDLKDIAVQAGTNHIAIPAKGLPPGIYVLEYLPVWDKAGYLKLLRE
jgi:hypothetical protein